MSDVISSGTSLVTSSLSHHSMIVSETEHVTVLEVIQKHEKDFVSNDVVSAADVNTKYFYGEVTQVWDGSLSGGVTEIMFQVIWDCYFQYK